MKLLVLGGTRFVGRHVVAAAIRAGYDVTIFHRGSIAPDGIAGVESLIGDRGGDVSALAGRRFDGVIDCSGYTPDHLRRTADLLAGHVGHYLFVSTRSVYRDLGPDPVATESSPLLDGADGYGAAKARSEEVLQAAMPGRVTIVRPGLVAGPLDPTGRFTYWPLRLHRGGDVLAPGRPERRVSFIDARDLADWCVGLAARPPAGVFDAVGRSTTMAGLLDTIGTVVPGDARLHWLSDDVLLAAGVTPWTELPLWIPDRDPFAGLMHGTDHRAVAAGLVPRPIADTVRDTLRWAADPATSTPGAVATMTALHEQLLLLTAGPAPVAPG